MESFGKYIADIALAVATPTAADQYFINIDNQDAPVEVQVPGPEAYASMVQNKELLDNMGNAQKVMTTIQCLLYGSFPEMLAEYNVQAEVPVRQKEYIVPEFLIKILQGVHLLIQDQRIPRARIKLKKAARESDDELYNKYASLIQEMIASHFDEDVRPPPHLISPLHRILDKIPATASEMLLAVNGNLHAKIVDDSLAVIDLLQLQLGRHLTQINQFTTDPIQMDDVMNLFTLILENKNAVTEDSMGRITDTVRIQEESPLFIQCQTSIRIFLSGELPGAIQPAKLHGLLSTTFHQRVQRAILQIAINQLEKYDHVGMPITTAYSSSEGLQGVAEKARFNTGLKAAAGQSKFLVPTPQQAKTDTHYQLSGNYGQEELSQILSQQNTSDRRVLDLGPTGVRLLALTISILIACCRVRLDAMSQTDLELMQEQDLYWLCVAKRLASHVQNPLLQTELVNLAERSIAVGLIMNKDRMVKIQNKDPTLQLTTQTVAKAELLVNEVLNTLGPIAEDNMFNSGGIQVETLDMLYKALTQNNRIQRDIQKRQSRRSVQLSQFRSK